MQNKTETFADKYKKEYEYGKRILDKYSVSKPTEPCWPIVVLVTAILSLCSGYLIGFVVGSLCY